MPLDSTTLKTGKEPTIMSRPTKQFNVLLTTDDRKHLNALAQQAHSDAATIIRQLIAAAYTHTILQAPTCANNQPCFVPTMHPRRNPPPGATPE